MTLKSENYKFWHVFLYTLQLLLIYVLILCIIPKHHYHQSVLPKSKTFTANSGTKAAVLLKGRSSTTNAWTKVAVLLGMDRCSSFPLLSAPHSLFSISTDFKRSEKIPGPPSWRWEEWIWLGLADFTEIHHKG